MRPSERFELTRRWMAARLGKRTDEIAKMSHQEVFDEFLSQSAEKHGIGLSEMSTLAELQAKIDSGKRLTSEEIDFLRGMNEKIRRIRNP